MPEASISLRHVQKTFAGRRTVTAISDLSFEIDRGEYVCIVGRTGCGKSTTVNLLLGVEKPTGGAISILGCDPYRDFNALRGRLGCVFQGDRLLPWRNAVDNVRVPVEIIGIHERDLKETPRRLLQRLGLSGFEHAYPHELSGGMRQRVGIARALVSDPAILLADEAFGHLDEVTGAQLRNDFRQIAKESGKTVVHITHSIDEAINLSDRVLVFGCPGFVVADIRLGENERGFRREQTRKDILSAIETPDLHHAAGAAAGIAA